MPGVLTADGDDADAALLRGLFHAAVAAAHPSRVVGEAIPTDAGGRIVVVGAGKAAAAMANEVESALGPRVEGAVVVPYGHGVRCQWVHVLEAAHPVPDEAAVRAAARVMKLVRGLTADDLVLALVSGGGSSVLTLPLPGITLADKQAVTRAMIHNGAPISAINAVRMNLSGIKGGRLAAAAYPAQVRTILISDVPGDDPAKIGSGPTVAAPTEVTDPLEILDAYGVAVSDRLRRAVQADKTRVQPSDPRLARSSHVVVAAPQQSLEAAARSAVLHGVTPVILGDAIEGEAQEVARVLAGVATQVRQHGQPCAPPCVLLSGGETTVSLTNSRMQGRGGRNVEFILSLAINLKGMQGITALSADTDGIDGNEPVAGAVIRADSLVRAALRGHDPQTSLERHDAHALFEALGDQVVTGPTLTNVNDFRAILIR